MNRRYRDHLGLLVAMTGAQACQAGNGDGREPLTVPALVGCYEVSLGEWSAPTSLEVDGIPPKRFQLHPDSTSQARLLRVTPDPLVERAPSRPSRSGWFLRSADSLLVGWSSGTSGVRLDLGGTPDRLTGMATYITDLAYRSDPVAAATVARISCDSL